MDPSFIMTFGAPDGPYNAAESEERVRRIVDILTTRSTADAQREINNMPGLGLIRFPPFAAEEEKKSASTVGSTGDDATAGSTTRSAASSGRPSTAPSSAAAVSIPATGTSDPPTGPAAPRAEWAALAAPPTAAQQRRQERAARLKTGGVPSEADVLWYVGQREEAIARQAAAQWQRWTPQQKSNYLAERGVQLVELGARLTRARELEFAPKPAGLAGPNDPLPSARPSTRPAGNVRPYHTTPSTISGSGAVVHVFCNGESRATHRRADGEFSTAYTGFMSAVRQLVGWNAWNVHGITYLSPGIAPQRQRWPALFQPNMRLQADQLILITLRDPVPAITLWGAKVGICFTAAHLHRLLPGTTRSPTQTYRGVHFCVLSTPTYRCWLIESPDAASPKREGRVFAAMKMVELLKDRTPPEGLNVVVELRLTDKAAIDRAMATAEDLFGADNAVAADEWDEEERENREGLWKSHLDGLALRDGLVGAREMIAMRMYVKGE